MIRRVDRNGYEIQQMDWVIFKVLSEIHIGYISDFTMGSWNTMGIRFAALPRRDGLDYYSIPLIFGLDIKTMSPARPVEKLPNDTDKWQDIFMLRMLEWM